MGLAGVSWTRHGESVGLRKGGIELESLFSVTLTCPPYARERRLSKTQIPQCTKCTKKTQKTQCTRCTQGGRWKIEDGRGEASLGGWRRGRPWPLTPTLSPSDGERRRGIARRPVLSGGL